MKFLGVINDAGSTDQGLGIDSSKNIVKGAGVQWLFGSGIPDNGGGKDNDMYLQDNGNVWKKTAGAWVFTGINLASSGGVTVNQEVISVSTAKLYFEEVVAAVGITSAHKIMCSFAIETDSENDIEEIADSGIQIAAIAETDQIRFILTGQSSFVGDFKINYWSTL
jgi:hypothetical protein